MSNYYKNNITLNSIINCVTTNYSINYNNFITYNGSYLGFTSSINEKPYSTNYLVNGVDICNNSVSYYIEGPGTLASTIPSWCNKIRAVLIGGGGNGASGTVSSQTAIDLNPQQPAYFQQFNKSVKIVAKYGQYNPDGPDNTVSQTTTTQPGQTKYSINYNDFGALGVTLNFDLSRFPFVEQQPIINGVNYQNTINPSFQFIFQSYQQVQVYTQTQTNNVLEHISINYNGQYQTQGFHTQYNVNKYFDFIYPRIQTQQTVVGAGGGGGGGGGFIYLPDYTVVPGSSIQAQSGTSISTNLIIGGNTFTAGIGSNGVSTVGGIGGVNTQSTSITINGNTIGNNSSGSTAGTGGGNYGTQYINNSTIKQYGIGGDGGIGAQTGQQFFVGSTGKQGYHRIYYLTG